MAAHQAGWNSIVVRDLRTSGVSGTRDMDSKSDLCLVDQAPPSHLLRTGKPEFGKGAELRQAAQCLPQAKRVLPRPSSLPLVFLSL